MPYKSGCLLTHETIVMLICPELFLISGFDPCISRGRFFGSKRSTYAWVNTVVIMMMMMIMITVYFFTVAVKN